MKRCAGCHSKRIFTLSGKCSDRFSANYQNGEENHEYQGYVPRIGIGGGDYIEFDLCLDCGRVQDYFPVPEAAIRQALNLED